MGTQGVYKIQNPNTKKAFIDASTNIEKKVSIQKRLLEEDKHANRVLQKDWNELGMSAFKPYIIEKVKDDTKLFNRRDVWKHIFNSVDKNLLYNRHTTHHKHFRKDVYLVNDKRDVIEEFSSVQEAAMFFNVSSAAITEVCRFNAKTLHRKVHGCYVVYREDYYINKVNVPLKNISSLEQPKSNVSFSINKMLTKRKK